MKGLNAFIALLFAITALGTAHAQYWFQTGAVAGGYTLPNNGASVYIETVKQHLTSGSAGFWVGQALRNGGFVQVGYLIESENASYPVQCGPSGCSKNENITAGDAEWFYEYFPNNASTGFLGAVGPEGSAGPYGSINDYSFTSNGDTWTFFMNGFPLGNVTISNSTPIAAYPVAMAEVSNATSAQDMAPVTFFRLSYLSGSAFTDVLNGTSYIGYGAYSAVNAINPYGIEETNGMSDYFAIGSGLPQPKNGTLLWSTRTGAFGTATAGWYVIAFGIFCLAAMSAYLLRGKRRKR